MKSIQNRSSYLALSVACLFAAMAAGCEGDAGRETIFAIGDLGDAVPAVSSVSPRNNATTVPTNQKTISAAFTHAMDPATINETSFTMACPAGAPVAGTVSYSEAGKVATLTVPNATNLPASTECEATITRAAKSADGVAMAADFAWTFTTAAAPDSTAPTVTSTVPAAAATGVAINSKVTASFSEPMNPATINTSTFTLECPAATPITGAVAYAVNSNAATFTPQNNLPANTSCNATITTGSKDAAGNAMTAPHTWTFTTGGSTDVIAPVVTSTAPAPATTGVATNSNVTAGFSESMDPLTINTNTFRLACPAGTPISGTVGYAQSGSVATFDPTVSNLPANTTCTATVTTGAKDIAGNAMASPFNWDFTTAASADVSAPIVTSTLPVADATGVAVNSMVNARFSEPMDALTITNASYSLDCPIGSPVAATVSYTANSNTATLDPAGNLPSNIQCRATITTDARDAAGNAMANPFIWNFTTGATLDTTPPTVTSTNPADLATGVCPTASVNATFSEPMDPRTLSTTSFTLKVTGPPMGNALSATISYDTVSKVATLNPVNDLLSGTNYTATITTDARDMAGNALALNKVWTFAVGPATGACGVQQAQSVALASAAPFGTMGGTAGMTNQGLLTQINGDISTMAVSTAVTGFHDTGPGCTYTETGSNVGFVNGKIYTAPPSPTVACPTEGTAATFEVARQAREDALAAYNYLAGLPTTGTVAANLSGLTVAPGVYFSATGFLIQNGSVDSAGDLTLDGQGDANATFVFQTSSTLLLGGPGAAFPRSVKLINGAKAKNVFWQVGSFATINAAGGGTMEGTILAQDGASFSTDGNVDIVTLNGRALSLGASVTVVNTIINVPAP